VLLTRACCAVYAELRATGHFVTATAEVDEAEHSLEVRCLRALVPTPVLTRAPGAPCEQMHLPYLLQCFAGRPFTLVPIIVGSLTPASEEARCLCRTALPGRVKSDASRRVAVRPRAGELPG
jgi:hypothetical protein